MYALWETLRAAVPLITKGNPYLFSIIWFTIQVAAVGTAIAVVIGLPIGLVIGAGRFRGRRILHAFANASLGLPPVLVGFFLLLLFVPQGPLGGLQLPITRRAVFIAQTVLALPYVVALTAAAVQGLPPGLLAQARVLGAGRRQLYTLALREARIGVTRSCRPRPASSRPMGWGRRQQRSPSRQASPTVRCLSTSTRKRRC